MKKKDASSVLIFLIMGLILLFGPTLSVHAATVAKIGSRSYSSLKSAIAAVQNNQTIKIQRNITQNRHLTIKNGKKFTIDFQNHTITIKEYQKTVHHPIIGTYIEKDFGYFYITKGNVTFKNGTVKTSSDHLDVLIIESRGTSTITNCKFYGAIGNDGGKLTINSGTFQSRGSNVLITNSGTLLIKNGTFKGTSRTTSLIYNWYKCTIYNGSFLSSNGGGATISTGENITVKKKATTTIKDGIIKAGQNNLSTIYVDDGGTVNISNGTFSGMVAIFEGGTLKMTGGSIKSIPGCYCALYVDGIFTMTGGTIASYSSNNYQAIAIDVRHTGKATLTKGHISGGATVESTEYPGNFTDYPVILSAILQRVTIGNALVIRNRGQGPNISAQSNIHRYVRPTT